MQDSLYRRFFLEPHQPLHRRYEALRAVFVDGQPQVEVAQRFGYTYNTLRRLVSDFRAQYRADQVPRWVKILELGYSREVMTPPSLSLSLVFFSAIPDTHHEYRGKKQRWSSAWMGRHCSHTLQGLSIRHCCCATS